MKRTSRWRALKHVRSIPPNRVRNTDDGFNISMGSDLAGIVQHTENRFGGPTLFDYVSISFNFLEPAS